MQPRILSPREDSAVCACLCEKRKGYAAEREREGRDSRRRTHAVDAMMALETLALGTS